MGKCTAADNLSGRGQVGTVSVRLLSLSVEYIELLPSNWMMSDTLQGFKFTFSKRVVVLNELFTLENWSEGGKSPLTRFLSLS